MPGRTARCAFRRLQHRRHRVSDADRRTAFHGGYRHSHSLAQRSSAGTVRLANKKVPKRVSRMVMSALEKGAERRPQTAIAFAHAMRATADGLGTLYQIG